MNKVLLLIAATLPFIWGVAHLFPTKNVVKDFGDISVDNKNIILMEWINEGITLIFIGILIFVVTIIDPFSNISIAVYWVCFGGLNVLSVVSLLTGFKVNFLPFKLCPIVFTGTSIFLVLGILI